MIQRLLLPKLLHGLDSSPAVAILGPRQVGKSTLAREVAKQTPSILLDLESPQDMARLADPMSYLSAHLDKLIILDEVQREPEIFQILRVLIDQSRRDGRGVNQFLVLGSASIDLLKQSSETLAGRIQYLEMTGINCMEAKDRMNDVWLRGGFPPALLAKNGSASTQWRQDFIRTYLERDVPTFGFRVPATTLRRFWTMLAHMQGSIVNASNLALGMDISSVTASRYIDLLCDLLLVRKIQPYFPNVGKRLVKAPKIYIRDSGLLHTLLSISGMDNLLSHPIVGFSWEGFVIENILSVAPKMASPYYYRTAAGAEIDLLLHMPGDELWAIEIKRTSTPKVAKGFHHACEDLNPAKKFIVYNGTETFPLGNGIIAISLPDLMEKIAAKV